MLPKINCLKADKDFRKVFNEGKTSEGNLIKIRFLKNFKKHSRFGFIISNTFESKAVSRNLIKRRLRAAVYFLLKNIKPGFDIIIWPKAALKKSTYQSILDNFKNIFSGIFAYSSNKKDFVNHSKNNSEKSYGSSFYRTFI